MHRNQLYPSKYLRHADLDGKTIAATIDKVVMETMSDGQEKPVLRFKDREKGMVLNRTNLDAIAAKYGDETREWSGANIELFPTVVTFKGQRHDSIRARPLRPGDKPTVADDGECPF